MSNWNGDADNGKYSRTVWTIARNMRITLPTGSELAALITLLKAIWNPQTQTGSRSWLQSVFQRKSILTDYSCNLDNEPTSVLVKLLGIIGRDLDENPVSNAEKALIDTFVSSVGNRKYGTAPYFGNVGGSTV